MQCPGIPCSLAAKAGIAIHALQIFPRQAKKVRELLVDSS